MTWHGIASGTVVAAGSTKVNHLRATFGFAYHKQAVGQALLVSST